MSLPTQYLTSTKNVKNILDAMQAAQAPKRFSLAFLQGLGFKSVSDRLIVGMLKALEFLNSNGEPTSRYFEFLDQTKGGQILAEGLQKAYADLFQVNSKANELNNTEIKNKLKTLTQGKYSETVIDKMAATFKAFANLADFANEQVASLNKVEDDTKGKTVSQPTEKKNIASGLPLTGLVYNIQIHLPESRDPAVYDALFRSLREHLL